ncbi:hypothetical protein JCM17823_24070 [Halorubrum gandharaense]
MGGRLVPAVLACCYLVAVAVAASVGAVGGGNVTDATPSGPESVSAADPVAYERFNAATAESEIATLVNDVRTRDGLSALDGASALDGLTRSHSVDMATRGYMAHETPDGQDLTDRARNAGVSSSCNSVGENVGRVYLDRPFRAAGETYDTDDEAEIAAALVAAWLESPDHRENLLSEKWSEQSVGISVDAEGAVYATHHFCER